MLLNFNFLQIDCLNIDKKNLWHSIFDTIFFTYRLISSSCIDWIQAVIHRLSCYLTRNFEMILTLLELYLHGCFKLASLPVYSRKEKNPNGIFGGYGILGIFRLLNTESTVLIGLLRLILLLSHYCCI